MATSKLVLKLLAFAALTFAFYVQFTQGKITCERLDEETCAYAISSTGKRCVLEKHVSIRAGTEEYSCRTSEIEAENLRNWIETDECIKTCGLDRLSFGISSDTLLDNAFTQRLCSPQCYGSCPNVVDLYFNLAAGEGLFLPSVCKAQEGGHKRRELVMADMRSSGIVAPGPVHGVNNMVAPGPEEPVEYMDAPSMAPSYYQ